MFLFPLPFSGNLGCPFFGDDSQCTLLSNFSLSRERHVPFPNWDGLSGAETGVEDPLEIWEPFRTDHSYRQIDPRDPVKVSDTIGTPPPEPVCRGRVGDLPTSDSGRLGVLTLGCFEVCHSESTRRDPPLPETHDSVRPSSTVTSVEVLSCELRSVILESTRDGTDPGKRESTEIRHRKTTLFGIGTHVVDSHSRYSGRSLNGFPPELLGVRTSTIIFTSTRIPGGSGCMSEFRR